MLRRACSTLPCRIKFSGSYVVKDLRENKRDGRIDLEIAPHTSGDRQLGAVVLEVNGSKTVALEFGGDAPDARYIELGVAAPDARPTGIRGAMAIGAAAGIGIGVFLYCIGELTH